MVSRRVATTALLVVLGVAATWVGLRHLTPRRFTTGMGTPAARARTQLEVFSAAILTYAKAEGRLPESIHSLLESQFDIRDGPGQGRVLLDPWGTAYVYEHGVSTFVLRSAGQDRRFGTSDDLVVSKDWASGG